MYQNWMERIVWWSCLFVVGFILHVFEYIRKSCSCFFLFIFYLIKTLLLYLAWFAVGRITTINTYKKQNSIRKWKCVDTRQCSTVVNCYFWCKIIVYWYLYPFNLRISHKYKMNVFESWRLCWSVWEYCCKCNLLPLIFVDTITQMQ